MTDPHEPIPTPGRKHIEPIGSGGQFYELMRTIPPGVDGRVTPDITQDGAYEIHPNLQGITFNFWISPDKTGRCAINFSGNAEKAPWSHELTGKVFNNFSEAKGWLR